MIPTGKILGIEFSESGQRLKSSHGGISVPIGPIRRQQKNPDPICIGPGLIKEINA
jgi:hypothetical protein